MTEGFLFGMDDLSVEVEDIRYIKMDEDQYAMEFHLLISIDSAPGSAIETSYLDETPFNGEQTNIQRIENIPIAMNIARLRDKVEPMNTKSDMEEINEALDALSEML